MRNVIIVGSGFTKVSGVGDSEVIDVDGYLYVPEFKIMIAIATTMRLKAIRPPDEKNKATVKS